MKRGLGTILLGVTLILIGGVAVATLIIIPAFTGAATKAAFKGPGGAEVMIEEPGRYYLWNEYRTIHEGKSYQRPMRLPDGIEFTISDADGRALPFTASESTSVELGNSAKRSVGYVEVERLGPVSIDVRGGVEERVFSFSQMHVMKWVGRIVAAIALLGASVLGGIALIVWGIVKLVNEDKSNRDAGISAPV